MRATSPRSLKLAIFGTPDRPSEIAGWLGLERSTVSRNVDVLAKQGYVHAAAPSATGRTTRVAVTEAGYRALAEAEPAWRRAQAWISGAVDPDAAEALDQWLTALDLKQQNTRHTPAGQAGEV